MQPQVFWDRSWFKWSAFLGFWTLLALSFASQFYIASSKAGLSVTWRQAITSSMGDWYLFALLAIPVRWLAHRFPFERPFWPGSLLVHLPASVLFSLVYVLMRAGLAIGHSTWNHLPLSYADALRPLLLKTWYFNLLVYWVVFAVSHAFDYYRKYQDREKRSVELAKRLTEAKLQALQMQLNPHFLFNTLNAIASLMHKDVEAADRMIGRLSRLLRQALDSSNTQEVPLRHELKFLQDYLVIEQTRFGDRLSVTMDVPPELMEATIPNLMLQPLVENAIIHGIEPKARPGRIELRARLQENMLELEVSDNGAGLPPDHMLEEGVGLANTRARLQELYGKTQSFELIPGPTSGVIARVRIPFRVASFHRLG